MKLLLSRRAAAKLLGVGRGGTLASLIARGDKIIVTCVCVGLIDSTPVLGGCVLNKAFRKTTR